MSEQQRLYIAGMGMITPVGANTAMTAAAVKAGISGYKSSEYYTQEGQQPITMTSVPTEIFSQMQVEIDEGRYYSGQYDRIIKMAILALREAVSGQKIEQPIPLILAMPEDLPNLTYIDPEALRTNLLKQKDLPLQADMVRYIRTGRAAGIQGLALAQRYLYDLNADYVLIGGSDSHWVYPRLGELDSAQRVLTPVSPDGFAPGEGAGFLLLTRHPEKAMQRDNHIISLSAPGSGEEPGHLSSEQPYQGEGLDQAFKQALTNQSAAGIRAIYASMNGEHHWAKEYGVAYIRNKDSFHESVNIEHPADCYGDLGSATGAVLMGLAADDLFNQPGLATHLVYSSSDGATRAAVRLEKTALIYGVKEVQYATR